MDVSAALTWIPDMVWPCGSEHPVQEISRQILADRVAMSIRNFERVFTRELSRLPNGLSTVPSGAEARALKSASGGTSETRALPTTDSGVSNPIRAE